MERSRLPSQENPDDWILPESNWFAALEPIDSFQSLMDMGAPRNRSPFHHRFNIFGYGAKNLRVAKLLLGNFSDPRVIEK